MDLGDGELSDIPTRPMRVKILYTFDQENRTNCLARYPDVLDIPAVAIDDSNQVGVIELQQCLQAIISASPEIISRLSNGDFTIYAHDYSEYDTPLVGQGLLSAALALPPPNQQNKTRITGRVCTNKLAVFSNGVKETLEVKLRLTPVPKAAGSDIMKSMDSMRGMSPAVSSGFDPNVWSPSVQQGRPQQQMNEYFNFDALSSASEKDLALVDSMFSFGSGSGSSGSGHQMTGGVGIAQTPSDPSFAFNPAFSHSAPGSRAGSPINPPDSSTFNDALRHQSFSGITSTFTTDQSRPASRASVRSEVHTPTHQRQASAPSLPQQTIQQQSEVYYNEDGQARKRAKVVQADWRGRSSFGSKSSDLRVNAATTASMQMHRPIAKRPSALGSNLEPPPRVPTPVPQRTVMLSHQQTQAGPRSSLLRQASTADSDFMSDVDNFSDAIMSSPEEESPGNSITAEGTPQEIPSSPPVLRTENLPEPSSPGLPTLPPSQIVDSGYMSERGFNSGAVMDSLEHDEENGSHLRDYDNPALHRGRRQRSQPFIKTEGGMTAPTPPMYPGNTPGSEMNIEMVMPGDMNQLPHKMLLNLPQRREDSQGPQRNARPATSMKPNASDNASASPACDVRAFSPGATQIPFEQAHSRRGSLALPSNPSAPSDLPGAAQRPVPKARPSVPRTRTSSNDSEAGSPAPSDTEGWAKGPQRSGSGAHRRKIIEQRLQSSIARGEMPKFCSHCGAIETPTWRRLYVKECVGRPTALDEAEGEGETIGVEITERDENTGQPLKFMIRKSMKKTKDSLPGAGFENLTVCNPCGLWFNKFRTMRPPAKWGRKAGTRRSKKQKEMDNENELAMSTDAMEPPSDMFFTDQIVPEDVFDSGEGSGDGQYGGPEGSTDVMPPPNIRPRANSMQAQQQRRTSMQGEWKASQLGAALARAVQSSPVRFNGSQESPIEIEDLTPKPTRRLLFPSPRREGEVNSLDDNGQVSLRSMPPTHPNLSEKALFSPKAGLDLNFQQSDTNIFEAFTFNKENMAPPVDGYEHDDLAYLFEGSPNALFRTPFKTPRKTPSKSTPSKSHRNLLKTPTPSHRKRKPLTPNLNSANKADNINNSNVNDFMTSPSSGRYWLRSTPSRLERTPGGGQAREEQGVSPWSRHLAQLLSDANEDGLGNGGVFMTSPTSRQFEFSDLPGFGTPGRLMISEGEWEALGSEFASFDDVRPAGGGEGAEGSDGGS